MNEDNKEMEQEKVTAPEEPKEEQKEEQKANKKKEKKKEHDKTGKIIVVLLLIILILLLLRSCSTLEEQRRHLKIGGHAQSTQTQEDTEETDTISIPGYSDFTVTEKRPALVVSNPEDNTVYLQYTIKEGDETLYESDALQPGTVDDVDLKSKLSVGEHTITIQINTYDTETEEACNGANQDVNVTVE